MNSFYSKRSDFLSLHEEHDGKQNLTVTYRHGKLEITFIGLAELLRAEGLMIVERPIPGPLPPSAQEADGL